MTRPMSVLEGAYRLTTINKAKKMVYIIQVLTLIGMTFLLLLYGGMSLQPFYLPLDSFVYFILIMFLVLMVEGLLFRALEMRFTKSTSRRYLMAKNSIKKSAMVMILALVCAVLLLMPFTAQVVEGTLGRSGELRPGLENAMQVYTRDNLGLTRVDSIRLSLSQGTSGNVYLLTSQQMEVYRTGDRTVLDDSIRRTFSQESGTEAPPIETFPHGANTLYLLFEPTGNNADGAVVDVSIRTSASPAFFTLVPILLLVVSGVSVGAIVYMTPKKKEYAVGSIYT